LGLFPFIASIDLFLPGLVARVGAASPREQRVGELRLFLGACLDFRGSRGGGCDVACAFELNAWRVFTVE
jgi:hypothetical protein